MHDKPFIKKKWAFIKKPTLKFVSNSTIFMKNYATTSATFLALAVFFTTFSLIFADSPTL
jgi:hypothetical protein